jgi:hypothetical protein
MKEIVNSTNGAKFLLSLLPYDSSFTALSTNEQEALEENLNQTSKKDVNAKKKEVFLAVFQTMAQEVVSNFQKIINNPRLNNEILALALGIIHGDCSSNEFVEACSELVVNWEVMNHGHGHRILKKIIELEVENGGKAFTKGFLKVMKRKEGYLEKLIKSKGVWIFVCLAEKSALKNKTRNLLKKFKESLDKKQSGEKALLDTLI